MMDNRSSVTFKEGTQYVGNNADLLGNLDGQEGYFEVIHKNQVFSVKCEDIPNHSPVLTSLIPTGERDFWLIQKISPTQAQQAYEERSRTATSNR